VLAFTLIKKIVEEPQIRSKEEMTVDMYASALLMWASQL
jgi:hypothetical protein